jgi:arylsulfatase A-like enzyme
MASEGVVFDNAISTCPVCTPYRGMVMTGKYPTHTGIVVNFVESNPRERCVAHVFKDTGYKTGFIGKWHLAAGKHKYGPKHNHYGAPEKIEAKKIEGHRRNQENPETEFVPPGPARLGFDHWQAYNFHMSFSHAYYYEDKPEKIFMPRYETDSETDMAIDFMQKCGNADQPFFLMVAPHQPHPPWKPTECPDGYLEHIPEDLEWSPNVPEDNEFREKILNVRCYHAMVKNTDDNIGRLLDFLDETGLSENTIMVFSSDHGEQLGSHGLKAKCRPYAESVNIPLIVRWPGHAPGGKRVDTLHTPMDHYPTFCALAGLAAPSDIDGADVSHAIVGGGEVERDAVLMANYVSEYNTFDSGTVRPEWRGVRAKTHTYAKWLAGGREELFDNIADPHQMKNLADDEDSRELLEEMRARLDRLMAEAHDEFLPGTACADWYDDERNLIKTALGPIE